MSGTGDLARVAVDLVERECQVQRDQEQKSGIAKFALDIGR